MVSIGLMKIQFDFPSLFHYDALRFGQKFLLPLMGRGGEYHDRSGKAGGQSNSGSAGGI